MNDGIQSLLQSLDGNVLIASLIWGSVGVAFTMYGKRQKEWVPLIGGLALIAISYFIGSVLYMSLAGVVLVAAIFGLRNRF